MDLVFHMDKELKFHKYVTVAVSKANHLLGIVKTTLDTLDGRLLPTMYEH